MPIRKNASFLTSTEREALVKACVLMKADIVNPAASSSQQYSRWDENVAIHWMIQAGIAPGTGTNPTPTPPWWPAGLTGWRLPTAFGAGSGALRRSLDVVANLPSVADLRAALARGTYPLFQNTLESGAGLLSFNQMHNSIHGWVGGVPGQMSYPRYSPFDPIFYLHHCNIDRLWTMWQLDGHANEYPTTGGNPEHNRNDIMYPWTGGAAGYGTSASIASAIPMPDFSAVGAKRNVDTLDYRTAFDYTYDTVVVIGIGLDRTGSMNELSGWPSLLSSDQRMGKPSSGPSSTEVPRPSPLDSDTAPGSRGVTTCGDGPPRSFADRLDHEHLQPCDPGFATGCGPPHAGPAARARARAVARTQTARESVMARRRGLCVIRHRRRRGAEELVIWSSRRLKRLA